MSRALIGHSGFVGGNLRRQVGFDRLFNSANFRDMAGGDFDLVVCAGLPAAKWLANQDPVKDRANMLALAQTLETVRARRFVLISTIDVYPLVPGLDEDFDCRGVAGRHAYGAHRLEFEDAVRRRFETVHVVRLPGLFGDGLKKNVIFDLLHDNCLEAIAPASALQWYGIGRLWTDIGRVVEAGLELCNLFTEPITTGDIIDRFFPQKSVGGAAAPAVHYDLRTRHGAVFGSPVTGYARSRRQVMDDLGAWLADAR